MIKGKFVLILVLVLLAGNFVSASVEISKSSYNYDTWTYKEDLKGKVKGFVLSHVWSSPSYTIKERGYGLTDWKTYDINTEPPKDSYSALNQAMSTYKLNKKPYYYSGYSGYSYGYYGYVRNSWW